MGWALSVLAFPDCCVSHPIKPQKNCLHQNLFSLYLGVWTGETRGHCGSVTSHSLTLTATIQNNYCHFHLRLSKVLGYFWGHTGSRGLNQNWKHRLWLHKLQPFLLGHLLHLESRWGWGDEEGGIFCSFIWCSVNCGHNKDIGDT
jgi:hypothetical protein